MSVESHLCRRGWDGRVYRRVEDYDPVLRSHCGMEPPGKEGTASDDSTAVDGGTEVDVCQGRYPKRQPGTDSGGGRTRV
jgi:hypothetical protein